MEIINISLIAINPETEFDNYNKCVAEIVKNYNNSQHHISNDKYVTTIVSVDNTINKNNNTDMYIFMCDVLSDVTDKNISLFLSELYNHLKINDSIKIHFLFFSHCNILFEKNDTLYLPNDSTQRKYELWIRNIKNIFNIFSNNVSWAPIYCKTARVNNDISSLIGNSTKYVGHNLLKNCIINNFFDIILSSVKKNIMSLRATDRDVIDCICNQYKRLDGLTISESQSETIQQLFEKLSLMFAKGICGDIYSSNIVSVEKIDFAITELNKLENISNNPEMIYTIKKCILGKKFNILNKKLEEMFDVDIFMELWDNDQLSIESYIKSIENTLKIKGISFESLNDLIKSISEDNTELESISVMVNDWLVGYNNK